MTGFVYAIRNHHGHVKIGWANKPHRRLAELNVASPDHLHLIGYAVGTKEHEQAIHAVLSSARIRGEWFDAQHPHVRLFLELLPCAERQARAASEASFPDCELGQVRRVRGWSQGQLADALGVSQTTISRLEAGERPIRPVLRKLIDQLPSPPSH